MDNRISVVVSICRNGQDKYGYGLLDPATGRVQVEYPEFADDTGVWNRLVRFGKKLDRGYALRRTQDRTGFEVFNVDAILVAEKLVALAA